jgi:putative endonuclease
MTKRPCVYILANRPYGTLYIGVTSDLEARISIHKQDLIDGFTRRYGLHRLVYYEFVETMEEAIRREKRIKKWNRAWKFRLINSMNPNWDDLFDESWGAVRDGPADLARSRLVEADRGSPPTRG